MEGICFEVKPRDDAVQPRHKSAQCFRPQHEEEVEEEEVQYRLTLVGLLEVHPQTTMAMLPWVVAEIRRPRLKERSFSTSPTRASAVEIRDQPVVLLVSAGAVRCMLDLAGPVRVRDPLRCSVLFECRPHRVTKLIRDSRDPSYFGCLMRDERRGACYVFRCHQQHEVPLVNKNNGKHRWCH